MLERRRAAGLWVVGDRCVGLVCDDGRAVASRAVVLATGGAAALWARTTNPPGAIGAGLLIAHDAGAALADLELMQFHPTAVAGVDGIDGFLVTEAVRGEGATLHDEVGERFVDELAPRDEVARAIETRLGQSGARGGARHARGRPGTLSERRADAAPGRASTRRRSSCRSPPPRTT